MVGAKVRPVEGRFCGGCWVRAAEVVVVSESPYHRTARTPSAEVTVFFRPDHNRQTRPIPPTPEALLGFDLVSHSELYV